MKVKRGSKLGSGAFGNVYEVDVTTDDGKPHLTDVVLKEMTVTPKTPKALFEREIHSLRAVQGTRYAVKYHVAAFHPTDNKFEILMERLHPLALTDGTLSIQEKIKIAGDLCEGLSHFHARCMIHGDIKPQNIMQRIQKDSKDSQTIHVVYTDFGLSCFAPRCGVAGTPRYLDPLVFFFSKGTHPDMQKKKIDQDSDIYSLGVVLYEMFMDDQYAFHNANVSMGEMISLQYHQGNHQKKMQTLSEYLTKTTTLSELEIKNIVACISSMTDIMNLKNDAMCYCEWFQHLNEEHNALLCKVNMDCSTKMFLERKPKPIFTGSLEDSIEKGDEQPKLPPLKSTTTTAN